MTIPAVIDRGPTPINIRLTRANDFNATLEVQGDRSADTFQASFRRVGIATVTAFSSVVVGVYAAGITPVTISLTDTLATGLGVTVYDRYFWDLKWVVGGLEYAIAGGKMTVLPEVVP